MKFTKADAELLLNQGLTLSEIAAKLEVSRQAVSARLKYEPTGKRGRPRGPGKKKPIPSRATCRDCKTEFDSSEFYRRGSGHMIYVCRECASLRVVKVNARKLTASQLEADIKRLQQILQVKLEVLTEKEGEDK